MELEKLVNKHGDTRTMVTKACDAGTKFLTDNITLKTLTMTRDKCVYLEDQLDDLDNKVYELLDVDGIDDDLVKVCEFKEKLRDSISSINFEIHKFSGKKTTNDDGESSVVREQSAKLPLLKIKTYCGDPLKWY